MVAGCVFEDGSVWGSAWDNGQWRAGCERAGGSELSLWPDNAGSPRAAHVSCVLERWDAWWSVGRQAHWWRDKCAQQPAGENGCDAGTWEDGNRRERSHMSGRVKKK